MPHFLPDAELITAYCGAYEARGCQFEVVYLPELSEYGLQMRYGANSSALPILPLPASEIESPEATERWMKHLRDEHLRNFDFILRRR